MGFYSRYILPPLIDCACSTKPIMKQREKVVPHAEGRVLEVGCGSGTNFGLYDSSKVSQVFALEPDAQMIKKAQKRADAAEGLNIEFMEAGGEAYSVVPCLNDTDSAIDVIEDIVRRETAGWIV